MGNILAVGIGGFIGSVARYLTYVFVRLHHPIPFPLATLLVNITGCFLLGFVSALLERRHFQPELTLMVTVGVIGGFTTFSALSLETVVLLRSGRFNLAFLSVAANLIIGLGAVWLGYVTMRMMR